MNIVLIHLFNFHLSEFAISPMRHFVFKRAHNIELLDISGSGNEKSIDYRHHRTEWLLPGGTAAQKNDEVHGVMRRSSTFGEEVLIDALLLARCDLFIHGNSSMNFAILNWQPQLPHINVFEYLQKICINGKLHSNRS